MSEFKPIIEALLLAATEPLTLSEIMRTLGPEKDGEISLLKKDISDILKELKEKYDQNHHGIQIAEVNGGYQFRTKSHLSQWINKLNRPKPTRLSKPAIESLAIMAYRQPITRNEVETIRGVDSGAVIKGLLERQLLRIVGRKDEPGRPLLYGTTPQFLELFGLKDLKELPPLKELEEQAQEMIRRSQESEEGETADLEGMEIDSSDLQWLDEKERETFEELDGCLKDMKTSDKKIQEVISPTKEETSPDEVKQVEENVEAPLHPDPEP